MRTLTILLAASLVLSSGSALASKTTRGEDKQQPASTTTTTTTTTDAKYCLDQSPDESTGTRIYTHECRTKSEWAKRGVDIDELKKQQ